MAVDDAGFLRQHGAGAGKVGLETSRLVARQEREAFDAVRQSLLKNALDLGLLEIVGGDDELAAFGVRHAVARTEGVEHAPPGDAVAGSQGAGGIIHAGMDHFAVARGDAVADAAGGLGDDHAMPAKSQRPRNRQPDDAGPDHQNVHDRLPLPKALSLSGIQ